MADASLAANNVPEICRLERGVMCEENIDRELWIASANNNPAGVGIYQWGAEPIAPIH